MDDRSVVINIYGEEYSLILTTKAAKALAARYDGLESLGAKLMVSENVEMALDEVVWVITLLANQSIQIYNLKHKDAPKDLLTEDEVELLTTPFEISSYKEAIAEALFRGATRNVESEDDGAAKNVSGG